MNRGILFFVSFLFLAFAFSFVSAEEISSDTTTQTNIMKTGIGAEVRLLQLEKAIQRMILHSEAVVRVVSSNGNETGSLESIIEEMVILLEEVKDIDLNNLNSSVISFVNIKEDAIDLRIKFKDEARMYLSNADKQKLVEEFKNIDRDSLKEYNQMIRDKIKEFNSKRIIRFIEVSGLNSDIDEKLANGEITPVEALKELRMEHRNLSVEEKREIRENFKENNVSLMAGLRVAEKRAEMVAKRAENRAEKLEERGFTNASNRFYNISQRAENRAERLNNLREKVRNNYGK